MKTTKYIIGLDLGQQNDYTVLSMIEVKNYNSKLDQSYQVIYLNRYPLRTSYPDIVDLVMAFINNPLIQSQYILIVDYTGVGRPVVDLLRSHPVNLVALNITGGLTSSWKGSLEVSVPKKEIISSTQVAFQQNKLKIASDINFLYELKKEFINFKAKITKDGNAQFNASSGHHDDIVMSLGLAIWYAEHIARRGKKLRIMAGN